MSSHNLWAHRDTDTAHGGINNKTRCVGTSTAWFEKERRKNIYKHMKLKEKLKYGIDGKPHVHIPE
jgi:hypothetical protein